MENNIKPNLYLINGPLGAGKTTFLKELLTLPEFKNARVIENEFASTSVDTEQLHDHQAEVKTIAGVCICCSTGDELADALVLLASSSEPVIIEATGVANSLKLIEKIVVSDMLDLYAIKHAVFIIDAVEAVSNIEGTVETYLHELKAADTVLVSKSDLVSNKDTALLMDALYKLKLSQVSFVRDGIFTQALLATKSHILDYFMKLDDAIENHDSNANYTIVDMSDEAVDVDSIALLWNHLRTAHGLQRMKGNLKDTNGTPWHIEATPGQCRVTDYTAGAFQLVLIGEDARSVTKATLKRQLASSYNQRQVTELLAMYDQYKTMVKEEAIVSSKVAKAKLSTTSNPELERQYNQLKSNLQTLSDTMTFANPIIWMMYKFEAYKDEAQPIRTMHDLRIHCSKEGYICTKRFNFLNEQLIQRSHDSLNNERSYNDDIQLDQVFTRKDMLEITSNQDFMNLWETYEYYQVDTQPAKWLNYL